MTKISTQTYFYHILRLKITAYNLWTVGPGKMSRENYFFFNANLQRSAEIFILNKNWTNNSAHYQYKSKENTEINVVTEILLAKFLFHTTQISWQTERVEFGIYFFRGKFLHRVWNKIGDRSNNQKGYLEARWHPLIPGGFIAPNALIL